MLHYGKLYENDKGFHFLYLFKRNVYLVCVTFSENGSNFTVIRFAALRLTPRNCFPIADTTPPERRIVPL